MSRTLATTGRNVHKVPSTRGSRVWPSHTRMLTGPDRMTWEQNRSQIGRPFVQWLHVCWVLLVTGALFIRGGARASALYLQRQPPPRAAGCSAVTGTDSWIDTVEATASTLRRVTRCTFGAKACLFESMMVCGGMRTLGYNACVVVGYETVTSVRGSPVHAWVEVDGYAVSEPHVTKLYREIKRYLSSRSQGTGDTLLVGTACAESALAEGSVRSDRREPSSATTFDPVEPTP